MSITSRPNEEENLYEWCCDWLNHSIEAEKPEFGNVKSFCLRILISDNDADRFQAQQYLASLYRVSYYANIFRNKLLTFRECKGFV